MAMINNGNGQTSKPSTARRFLSSGVSFNLLSPFVIAVALVLVAAGTIIVVRSASVTGIEESVRLSDGHEVHLGEPTGQVATELGTDLHKVNDQLFQYPGDKLKPVEAIILAENGVVSAIQLIHGGNNVLTATGITVGTTQAQLAARLRDKISPLQANLLSLNLRGVQVNQTRSVAILLNPPCGGVDRINTITIAFNTFANKLAAQTIPADCGAIKE